MAAGPAQFITVLIVTLCLSLQEGFGHPLSGHAGPIAQPRHIRAKRCSCNNQMDSECHYFCHLDIIWVNTPSKTTVYGLGSPLSRRRRSADRCACTNPSDRSCVSFCLSSSHHASPTQANPSVETQGSFSGRANVRLLASLRNVIKDNLQAVRRGASPRKKSVGLWGSRNT